MLPVDARAQLPIRTWVGRVAGPVRIGTGGRLCRLPLLGLFVVLLGLPGFALWGVIRTHESGMAAQRAALLGDAFTDARYAVGAEESLERKYRLQPSEQVRALHRAAAAAMTEALSRAEALAGAKDAALIESVLTRHTHYLLAIERMFAAVDAGDTALVNRIDGAEVDPDFDAIEARVFAAAWASRLHFVLTIGIGSAVALHGARSP